MNGLSLGQTLGAASYLAGGAADAGPTPDLTFYTDVNGVLDPYITTADASSAIWSVAGEADQHTASPMWTLDGTDRLVEVYFDDPDQVRTIRLENQDIYGDISDWNIPDGVTILRANGTSLSGDISSWSVPASMVTFYLFSTTISGVPDLSAMENIRAIYVNSCDLSQANVDAWLEAIYNRWSALTWASPTLSIAGSNAAPSGTLQDSATPSTGLEWAYKLINDPDATGNNTWSITYTSP